MQAALADGDTQARALLRDFERAKKHMLRLVAEKPAATEEQVCLRSKPQNSDASCCVLVTSCVRKIFSINL
jgi:hypothetical protein